METFSALLALCWGNPPLTGVFPSQRTVTWGFGVSFNLRLNKRLSKQSRCRWFETASRSLWRHCDDKLLFHKAWRNCHKIISIQLLSIAVSKLDNSKHNSFQARRYVRNNSISLRPILPRLVVAKWQLYAGVTCSDFSHPDDVTMWTGIWGRGSFTALWQVCASLTHDPDNKVHGAIMGPTWDLSVPDGPHVGPMKLGIGGVTAEENCWDGGNCWIRSGWVYVTGYHLDGLIDKEHADISR